MIKNRLTNILLSIFCLFLLSACTKKLISENKDEMIHPKYPLEKKIQISQFVNQSKSSELDLFEMTIPQFLKDDLSTIKKIRFPIKQIDLTNKKEILNEQKVIQLTQSEKMKELITDLQDLSENVLSEPLKTPPKPEQEEKIYSTIKEAHIDLWNKKEESITINNYLQFYYKNRKPLKPYLGINIDKPLDVISTTYPLKVEESVITLQSRKVFQLSRIYSQLSKAAVDYTVVGVINKDKNKVLIHIKLYDNHYNEFVLSETFSYDKKDLRINLDKKIKEISGKLIQSLTQFPKGELIVRTEPKKAYVFYDGRKLGRSNLKRKVSIGFHHVEVLKQGYEKKRGYVYILPNKTHKLSLKLSKKVKMGSLVIRSKPSGADVFIDLDYKGKTPLKVNNLLKGVYKVRLEKEDFKYSYALVSVKPQKTHSLFFKMTQGKSEYVEVEKLSKTYNVVKNVFFYSSLVSISAMLYAYLQTEKYKDKAVGEAGSTSPNLNKFYEYTAKYKQNNKVRNITIITSVSLLVVTAVFQLFELHSEDIDVGFTPKTDESLDEKEKDVGVNFKIQFKF